jgi:hypothetical protein
MMDKLEENLEGRSVAAGGPVRRASTKDALKHKYEAEDRLRQQQEDYPLPDSDHAPLFSNRAASPDSIAESPTLR